MSINVLISVIYGVTSFIIILIFASLLQNLFCAQQRDQTTHSTKDSTNLSPTNDASNRHRTHSISSVTNNIIPIIPTNIASDTSTTNTVTANTVTPKSLPTTTPSNPSRTRSTSFSISRRTSLPHAVGNLINNMKSMLYQMEYKDYQSNEIQLEVRCASIISCFGFLICISIICIYFTMESIHSAVQNHTNHSQYNGMKLIAFMFYVIGKHALYIVCGARLFYSLEGGVFQYSISVYVFITIYFVIHLIITIASILLLYVGSYAVSIICVIIFYLMDAFYLILLYTLFTKQLLKVIRNTAAYISSVQHCISTNNNNPSEVELQTSSTLNIDAADSVSSNTKSRPSLVTKQKAYIGKQQISGIEYVTKYSVLILWSVLSSMLMSIMLSAFGATFVEKFNDRSIIHIIWCIDCVINSFSIYLHFIFGKWIYKRLCGICHKVTSKACDKLINRMN